MRIPPAGRRARRGFSLPELLISMVMIAIIGVALSRLVVSESRFNTRQVLQRDARGISRSALNIMTSELRMLEQSSAFDMTVPPTATSMTVFVPWAVGVACNPTTIAVLPVDSVAARLGVAHTVRSGLRASDGTYTMVANSVAAPALPATCVGLNVDGASAMPNMRAFTLTSSLGAVALGQPVMLYYRVLYEFKASTMVPGQVGLYRHVFGQSEEELLAPFTSTAGFQYYYGNDRMPSGPPAVGAQGTVTGIQLDLFALSERNAQGKATPETSTFSTAIFFRNRAD